MKLNKQNLNRLAPEVTLPAYALSDTRQGIAHIGVGGFHRAHQAYYTDALMNTGEGLDWAICGVGLRAEDRRARDDLKEQDYLFTLFELGDTDDTEVRVIGAIRDMLLAEDGAAALILAHNHPSGNPTPSQADRSLTQRLKESLALVDVRVLDHIIIGEGEPLSMVEHGWM